MTRTRHGRRARRRRQMRTLLRAAIALPLLFGAWLAGIQIAGNFHEVVPHVLYRSAQPTAAQLKAWRASSGIRTVVNLRGAHPGAGWYENEIAASRRLGLTHVDFAMSAGRRLNRAERADLLALLADAPKPLLVHCRSGADRTGLASVIYLAQIEGRPVEEAEGQLSVRYGHIGIPAVSEAYAMDETWEEIEHEQGLEEADDWLAVLFGNGPGKPAASVHG